MAFWRWRGWWNEFLACWQGRPSVMRQRQDWQFNWNLGFMACDCFLVNTFLVGQKAGRRGGNGPIPWNWHSSRWVPAAPLWWDSNPDVWQQFLTRQRMRSRSHSCTGALTWPIDFNSNSPSSSCSGMVEKTINCKMEPQPTPAQHNKHTLPYSFAFARSSYGLQRLR